MVWKQEVVVNMLKNQVDMNFTAAQAACLRVHRKMDSETEGTRQPRCFKERSFLSLTITYRISPGVNAARTRLEIER